MDEEKHTARIGANKFLVYHQNPERNDDDEFIQQFQKAATSQPATLQDFFITLDQIQQQSPHENIPAMQIELRNIKVAEHMSEETIAFTANLYVNNTKIAFVKNEGHGGNTYYQPYKREDTPLLRQAEEYCKSLPPIEFPSALPGVEPFELPMNLENYIDDLLDKHLRKKDLEKFHRKIVKHQEDSILFGIPDKKYQGIVFSRPLTEMLQSEKGIEALKNVIQGKIIPRLKEGEVILNTNLPAELLKIERKKINKSSAPQDDDIERKPQRRKR